MTVLGFKESNDRNFSAHMCNLKKQARISRPVLIDTNSLL